MCGKCFTHYASHITHHDLSHITLSSPYFECRLNITESQSVARAHDALVSRAKTHAVDESAVAAAEVGEPKRAICGERKCSMHVRDGWIVHHQFVVAAASDADAFRIADDGRAQFAAPLRET